MIMYAWSGIYHAGLWVRLLDWQEDINPIISFVAIVCAWLCRVNLIIIEWFWNEITFYHFIAVLRYIHQLSINISNAYCYRSRCFYFREVNWNGLSWWTLFMNSLSLKSYNTTFFLTFKCTYRATKEHDRPDKFDMRLERQIYDDTLFFFVILWILNTIWWSKAKYIIILVQCTFYSQWNSNSAQDVVGQDNKNHLLPNNLQKMR